MDMNRILLFAKENLSDGAMYAGKWRGYDVYEPIDNPQPGYSKYDVPATGLPYRILVKGEAIRMTSAKEAMQCLGELKLDEKYRAYLDDLERGQLELIRRRIESGEIIILDPAPTGASA